MLPAPDSTRLSLADVMPACLDAVTGRSNRLALAPVAKAVIFVVDGLGISSLRARSGHSRELVQRLSKSAVATAGFPTTTAASLATITTGEPAGVHGLVGYSVLDAAHDRVVNQLTGWDGELDPATWQGSQTVFQRAESQQIASFAVAAEQYRGSGFTAAVLRGASFRGGNSLEARFAEVRTALDSVDRGIVYVYAAELDKAGHSHGWQSAEWTIQLEALDAAVGDFAKTLRRDEGMLLTADHGMIDVPNTAHVHFDTDPKLLDGIRFVAGEPRCLQLHFEPDATVEHRERVIERWRSSESSRAWILDRDGAIRQGWFGPVVRPAVRPRIGDVLVAARKQLAYYDSRANVGTGRSMVGQHGSWSAEETSVPLLRFGIWQR